MNEQQLTYATTCLRYMLTAAGIVYTVKTIKDLLIAYKSDIVQSNTKKEKPTDSRLSINATNMIVNVKNGGDLSDNLSTRDFEGFMDAMNEINPSVEPSTDEDFTPNIIDDIETTDNQLDMEDVVLVDQDDQSYGPDSDANEQKDASGRDAPQSRSSIINSSRITGGIMGVVDNYVNKSNR